MSEEDFNKIPYRHYVRPFDIENPEKSIILSYDENIKYIFEKLNFEEDIKYEKNNLCSFEAKAKVASQIIKENGDNQLTESTHYILKKLFGFI